VPACLPAAVIATLLLKQAGSIYRAFREAQKQAEKKVQEASVKTEQARKLLKRDFRDSINVSLNMLQQPEAKGTLLADASRRKLVFRTLFTTNLGDMFDDNEAVVKKIAEAASGTTVTFPFMHLLNDGGVHPHGGMITDSEWPCLTKILNKISEKY
jgi:hypothetical protein